VRTTPAGTSASCPSILDFPVTLERIAPHFDSTRKVWELYIRKLGGIARHDIDSLVTHTEVDVPIDSAVPLIAADLDLDGSVELVSQWGDKLLIHSGPDWTLRASWRWPGFNIEMNPVLTEIDGDLYSEIYVNPHSFGVGRAVIIDYDTSLGTFVTTSDIPVPNSAAGYPAVGDFDEDGRVEFISGNNIFGYSLLEWQATGLSYIGVITDTAWGGNATAVACRPKPDGKLYALLGHSSSQLGFRYQLLEAVDDNEFVVAHTFQEQTGATGIHPCWAADTDCDGLEELVMHFYPMERQWEWDLLTGQFIHTCAWGFDDFGSLVRWYTIDIDQNRASEFASVNHAIIFRVFQGDTCYNCEESGECIPPGEDCYCHCFADPGCDGLSNVFDVVAAVDVAFRSAAPMTDPFPQCPYVRSDVNCDGVTNVFDVIALVDVAFRNGVPAQAFCTPCP